MKAFLNLLRGNKMPAQIAEHDIENESLHAMSRSIAADANLLEHIPATPPKVVSGTIAEKAELARWLVATLSKTGSVTLPFMLERMLDVRICSLSAYYLAVELFGSYGATFASENLAIAKSLGFTLDVMPSGRVADVGQTASLITPAKYRGYGNPINAPESRGHLYQINMCSFAEKNPVIGIQDWQGSAIIPLKGMSSIGMSGTWKLFELDMDRTDDMTAVFICPSNEKVQIEVAHFIEDEEFPRMIYRQSNIRGMSVEELKRQEANEQDDEV